MVGGTAEYWNHNTAFHAELVRNAAQRGGTVLDVGCGDGLLLSRLALVGDHVIGVDCDDAALGRAQERLHGTGHEVICGDLLDPPTTARLAEAAGSGYATITCVATLHHMDTRQALRTMADLLAPGGRLLVVGLAAMGGPLDWLISAVQIIPIRMAGLLHHEQPDIGVQTTDAKETLTDIESIISGTLPGARIRRRFYYRYTLEWTKPKAGAL